MAKFTKKALIIWIFSALGLAAILLPFGALADVTSGSPTLSFSVNTNNINRGDTATLTWFSQNTLYCDASSAWNGQYLTYGNFAARPAQTSNFGITCVGTNGSVSDIITVFVNQPVTNPPPSSIVTPNYYPSPTPPPVYVAPPIGALTAGCAASPTVAEVGQTITFAAASNGGAAPYRYSWSGNVSASVEVFTTSFNSIGQKSSTITITDRDGRTAYGYCNVQINPKTVTYTPPAKPKVIVAQAPICKTVTICFDSTTGKTYEQNNPPATATETPQVTEATSSGSFLASIFGSNTNQNIGSLIKFYVIILILAAIAAVVYFVVKLIKGKKQVQ